MPGGHAGPGLSPGTRDGTSAVGFLWQIGGGMTMSHAFRSPTALSGRPTTKKAGRPLETWTCTSTGTASIPEKAKD